MIKIKEEEDQFSLISGNQFILFCIFPSSSFVIFFFYRKGKENLQGLQSLNFQSESLARLYQHVWEIVLSLSGVGRIGIFVKPTLRSFFFSFKRKFHVIFVVCRVDNYHVIMRNKPQIVFNYLFSYSLLLNAIFGCELACIPNTLFCIFLPCGLNCAIEASFLQLLYEWPICHEFTLKRALYTLNMQVLNDWPRVNLLLSHFPLLMKSICYMSHSLHVFEHFNFIFVCQFSDLSIHIRTSLTNSDPQKIQ